MPRYRNDGAVSYAVVDMSGEKQIIVPSATIETYEDLSDFTDFTEIAAVPAISATMSGENQWTGALIPKGQLNVSISNPIANTLRVTLQRSYDEGQNWFDREYYDDSIEDSVEDGDAGVCYRLGIKAGDHTSGEAAVRLSK